MAKSDAIERFRTAAATSGVHVEPVRYPAGTKTAADAARAIGCDVAQIVKSLVFLAGDEPVLALTSGANRVDTHKLGALVGTEVRRANADEVRAATGFAIGGTPPFGHPAPVRTFLDPVLAAFDEVWAAAGTPDSVFCLRVEALRRATGATVADFAEHDG